MCQPDADARSSGQCALGRCTQIASAVRSSRWLRNQNDAQHEGKRRAVQQCNGRSVDMAVLHNAVHQYGHADLLVCETSS